MTEAVLRYAAAVPRVPEQAREVTEALTRSLLDKMMVDREMCVIRDAGKVKARERIAVLAALNLAYQLAEAPRAAAPAAPVASTLSTPELDALVKRLDEALEHDGQLL